MGQIVLIDENELKELKMSKAIAEQYRKTFDKVYPVLFPEVNNFISDEILSNPIRNWEYDCFLLEGITKKILNKKRRRFKMGGRWSICARNLDDKCWKVGDYNLSLLSFIFKGIYCLIKYEVVELGKHG